MSAPVASSAIPVPVSSWAALDRSVMPGQPATPVTIPHPGVPGASRPGSSAVPSVVLSPPERQHTGGPGAGPAPLFGLALVLRRRRGLVRAARAARIRCGPVGTAAAPERAPARARTPPPAAPVPIPPPPAPPAPAAPSRGRAGGRLAPERPDRNAADAGSKRSRRGRRPRGSAVRLAEPPSLRRRTCRCEPRRPPGGRARPRRWDEARPSSCWRREKWRAPAKKAKIRNA